ncbi:MAG TPA: hypothetical protein DDW52_07775 [Planctomycetaceae bacterium]|nr:hypothetical protein [Planctomycetaceae bacterium]
MAHDVNQREMDVPAQVRLALIEKISAERVDLWIAADTAWSWDGSALRLSFSSEFACDIARKMLGREIAEVAKQMLGDCGIDFAHDPAAVLAAQSGAETRTTLSQPVTGTSSESDSAATDVPAAIRIASGTESSTQPIDKIDDRAVVAERSVLTARRAARALAAATPATTHQKDLWRQVVRGSCNELAYTTASLVIKEPGRLTPVFISGPNGCGKSLLAASIAQQLRVARRLRRVVHMTSEQFTNDFMDGLRGGGLPMFRRKYREVEALVLDDVQFFAGKKSTLAEVKHTLDNLLNQGKQVVCTADRSLNELGALGQDIVGRLRGGLVTPMFPIDAELRAQMLTKLLDDEGIEVESEVIEQLAERCAGDGRVVHGVCKRLMATAALRRSKLSWSQCWEAVYDLVQATQPVVRIGDIERVVCSVFGLEPDSLQSSTKMRSVSQPRMLAMFLARRYTPAAYKEIGEYFGRRRHSTVISAEKTVEGWLNESSEVAIGRGLSVRDALRHVESQLQVG